MGSKFTKGIRIPIGGDTTPLRDALKAVNSESGKLQRELTTVDKLLKLDPTNTELLAQKQSILKESISNTTDKLKMLEKIQDQIKDKYKNGEIDNGEYRKFQRELIETQNKLKRLEREASALDTIGDNAKESSRDVDKLNDKLEDTADKADDISDEGLSVLGKTATVAVAGVTALGAGLVKTVDASKEFRTEVAKLTTVSKNSGASADYVKEKWKDLTSVLGDEGAVTEGLNNIVNAGFTTQEQIDSVTQYLEGASIKWKDTLKFEGLADGLQETLATGKSVGPFAELLERAGVVLEDFDKGLANCKTSVEKQNYALQTLSQLGLKEVSESYREQNKAMIESEKTAMDYSDSVAKVGEKVEPILTSLKKTSSDLMGDVAEFLDDESVQKDIKNITKIAGDALKTGVDIGKKALPVLSKGLSFATENTGELLTATGAAVLALKGYEIGSKISKTIGAVTTAQQALNAAMTANPIGSVIAIAGAAISVGAGLCAVLETQEERVEKYTAASREEYEQVQENIKAYKDLKAEKEEAMLADIDQIDYTQRLWKELQTLCDENGNVKKGYEDRVKFITDHLEDALGIEIDLNGDIIQGYKDIQKEIDTIIAKQRAEIILNFEKELHDEAITNQTGAAAKLSSLKSEYDTYKNELITAQRNYGRVQTKIYNDAIKNSSSPEYQVPSDLEDSSELYESQIEAATVNMETTQKSITEQSSLLEEYLNNIARYEVDLAKVASGDLEKIAEVNARYAESYVENGETIKLSLKEQYDLQVEIQALMIEASRETGSSITDQMLKEQQKRVDDAKEAWEASIGVVTDGTKEVVNTVSDGGEEVKKIVEKTVGESIEKSVDTAVEKTLKTIPSKTRSLGKNIALGVAEGINEEQENLNSVFGTSINSMLKHGEVVAEIKSPSKRAKREIGKWILPGIGEALKEDTPSLLKTMQDSLNTVFNGVEREPISMAKVAQDSMNSLLTYDSELLTRRIDQLRIAGAYLAQPFESNIPSNNTNDFMQAFNTFANNVLERLERIETSQQKNVYLDGRTLIGYIDEGIGGLI